jgi:simple sugar transport system ATP-binding protein
MSMPTQTGGPLLRVTAVSRHYGGVAALRPSDLTIHQGRVHGILGKNGAGKSTLLGIVAGSVRPDEGEVWFRGEDVTSIDQVGRQRRGIALLEQHPDLIDGLTVAENLITPRLPTRYGIVSWRAARQWARQILDGYGLHIDVETPCRELGAQHRRQLAIVRAMSSGGDLILLDEPTASLTGPERSVFFDWLDKLRGHGKTFVLISHFTNEIRQACTDYTILRDGCVVDQGVDPGSLSMAELADRVVGGAVDDFRRSERRQGEIMLKLTRFSVDGLEPFDLEVRRGEVIGLAGVPGSGISRFARGLAGLGSHWTGEAHLNGRPVRPGDVSAVASQGIAYLTGDRQAEGLIRGFGAAETMVVGHWPSRPPGLVNRQAIRERFRAMAWRLSIRASSAGQLVTELSGGNQQKVLLARTLGREPLLLILDEPTHGIDVGSKVEVHRIIDEIARSGSVVMVVAYDTEELLALADRVLVFSDGRLAEVLTGDALHPDAVVNALGGGQQYVQDGSAS